MPTSRPKRTEGRASSITGYWVRAVASKEGHLVGAATWLSREGTGRLQESPSLSVLHLIFYWYHHWLKRWVGVRGGEAMWEPR